MGSDGLFDNLFDREILSIVRSHVAAHTVRGRLLAMDPQKISDALAKRARTVSRSKMNVDSPFQERAVHEGIYYQVSKNHLLLLLLYINK
jgi:hypothetical protein